MPEDITVPENGFDLENDFTILYPNNGTEQSPANVASNNQYVLSNPFPGYHVYGEPEVKYNNKWVSPKWTSTFSEGNWVSYGVSVSQLNEGDIVVQTGKSGLCHLYMYVSGAASAFSSVPGSLPCRVKVWKVGKIST